MNQSAMRQKNEEKQEDVPSQEPAEETPTRRLIRFASESDNQTVESANELMDVEMNDEQSGRL